MVIKLSVGVSAFDSAKELPRALDPIYKHVDTIYVVDGRYEGFQSDHDVSQDNTEDLLKSYPNVVYDKFGFNTQINKRNRYLELADKDKMDFLMVLDTDDYLHKAKIYQKWNKFYKQLEKRKDELLFNMLFWMNPTHAKNWNQYQDNTWVSYTRVYNPSRIRYAITHWTYIDVQEPDYFVYPDGAPLDHIRFDSDSTRRTDEYVGTGFNWAKWNSDQENARLRKNGRMIFKAWNRRWEKVLEDPDTLVIHDGRTREQKKNTDIRLQKFLDSEFK